MDKKRVKMMKEKKVKGRKMKDEEKGEVKKFTSCQVGVMRVGNHENFQLVKNRVKKQ